MTPTAEHKGIVVGLTGATGHIGGLLLQCLLDDPRVAQVKSVARRAPAPERAAEAATGRLVHTCADLREPSARHALEGVDLLYHLGAQVWQGRSAAVRNGMYGANVEGTRNVVRARPGALVFVSSAAVYGAWPDNPRPIDEAHEARPNVECPYALQKLLAEKTGASEVARHVVVRLTAVLGAHADARVARAVHGYRWAVPAIRGADQALQWLDEDDAVEGLLAAGSALTRGRDTESGDQAGRDVTGEVINLAPSDWLEAKDIAALAHSRVVELRRRLVVSGAEVGRLVGLSPFGADRAVLIAGPLALSPAKAAQLLGWRATRTSAEVLTAALGDEWKRLPRNRQL